MGEVLRHWGRRVKWEITERESQFSFQISIIEKHWRRVLGRK